MYLVNAIQTKITQGIEYLDDFFHFMVMKLELTCQ